MEYGNELYHWGIKGMKWGVRRYQNTDGSLTGAGRRRYQIKDGVMSEKGKKRYDKDTAALKAEKKHLRAQLRTTKKMEKLNKLHDETDELKKKAEDTETPEAKRERLLKSTDPKELYENRSLLSTAELNERINRIDTEARLNSKISVEKQQTGIEKVNEKLQRTSDTLNNVTNTFRKVDEAYSTVAKSAIGKALAKKLGFDTPKKEFNLDDVWKNRNKMSDEELKKASDRIKNMSNIKKNMDTLSGTNNNGKNKNNSGVSEDDVEDIINRILDERGGGK